jgi:Uma2 family endonuclease
MTEEEYIQFELNADIRHEYVNGQLIDIPGDNGYNNQIAQNLSFICRSLKKEGYRPYTHDIKVKVSGTENYFYPDLFLSKGPAIWRSMFIPNRYLLWRSSRLPQKR